ncbi:hypothetical protein ABIF79_011828 [Bradyrhizobium japonicum]
MPQVDQEFAPALRALAHADLEADQLLLAFRRGANQHQHAFAVIFHAGLQVHAIGPDVDIATRRQIASLPAFVLDLPIGLQAGDHRRRQVRRILAEQRRERLLEVAGRDAAQIEDRDQGIQALRPPRP